MNTFSVSLVVQAVNRWSRPLAELHGALDRAARPARQVGVALSGLSEQAGLGRLSRAVGEVGDRFAGVGRAASGVLTGVVLPLAGAVAGVSALVGRITGLGDGTAKVARMLGVSSDKLQAWRHAAEMAGVPAEQFDRALSRLAKNAVDAAAGVGDARLLFQAMGVAVKDAQGRVKPTETLFEEVVEKLSRVAPESARAGLAARLFGEDAARMGLLAKGGAAGLRQAEEAARRLGMVIPKDTLEQSEKFRDAVTTIRAAALGAAGAVMADFLPALNAGIAELTAWWAANRQEVVPALVAWTREVVSGVRDLVAWLRASWPAVETLVAALGGWRSVALGVAAVMGGRMVLALGTLVVSLFQAAGATLLLGYRLAAVAVNAAVLLASALFHIGAAAVTAGTALAGWLASSLGLLARAIMGAATWLGIVGRLLGGLLVQGLLAAARAAMAFGAALMATPVGWILAAVAAIALAAWLIWDNWSTVSEFLSTMWEGLKIMFRAAVDGLVAIVTSFHPVALVAKGVAALAEYLFGVDLAEAGGRMIASLWRGVREAWGALAGWVSDQAGRLFGWIPGMAGGIAAALPPTTAPSSPGPPRPRDAAGREPAPAPMPAAPGRPWPVSAASRPAQPAEANRPAAGPELQGEIRVIFENLPPNARVVTRERGGGLGLDVYAGPAMSGGY